MTDRERIERALRVMRRGGLGTLAFVLDAHVERSRAAPAHLRVVADELELLTRAPLRFSADQIEAAAQALYELATERNGEPWPPTRQADFSSPWPKMPWIEAASAALAAAESLPPAGPPLEVEAFNAAYREAR